MFPKTFQRMFDKISGSVENSQRLYELLQKTNGFSYKLNQEIPHPSIALQVIYKIDQLGCVRTLCKHLDKEIQFWLDECDKSRIDLTGPSGAVTAFDVWLKTNLPRRGFKINLFNPRGNPGDKNNNHPHKPPQN